MYNKGLKIINKKVKEKWQIAQKVIKGILIHWFISIEPGTNVKKIVNWPCDKLNSASLFIILLVGQEVEIWMSTWSFRPAAYIEWMVAVLMTKRYKWNGLNLVVLGTLVLKAPVKEVIPVVLVFNHDLPEHYCDWACLHQKNIIVKSQAMNNTKPQGSQL